MTARNWKRAPDVSGLEVGDKLLYCPICPWQADEPNIGMKNQCPECGASLNIAVVEEQDKR